MEQLTFKLDNFEGPLDLLLFLISKNKMDLHDIPILELIAQYSEIIRQARQEKLDLASEFIEMAARLVEMKSYLLLPRSEEAERMKQELTGQLIEYDLCRRVAGQLRTRAEGVYAAVRTPQLPDQPTEYALHHSPQLLVQAWDALNGRGLRRREPDAERFEPIVAAPFVSVSSRVVYVLRNLVAGRVQRLQQLFRRGDSRSTTVATFLAVLELIRHGRLEVGAQNAALTMNRSKIRTQEEQEQWT